MRENTPILLGRVSEEVSHLFKQKSYELQAPIANIDREIQLLSTDNQTLRVIYSDWESPNLNLPMLGKHQENNTGLAVTAAHLFDSKDFLRLPIKAFKMVFVTHTSRLS